LSPRKKKSTLQDPYRKNRETNQENVWEALKDLGLSIADGTQKCQYEGNGRIEKDQKQKVGKKEDKVISRSLSKSLRKPEVKLRSTESEAKAKQTHQTAWKNEKLRGGGGGKRWTFEQDTR